MFGDHTIEKVADVFIANLKDELRDQGHHLTGELEASIKTFLYNRRTQFVHVLAEDYIHELDQGVPAWRISKSDAYVFAMIEYVKKRMGASHSEANQIGWAIAKKHRREGMPTEASKIWSDNGERTGAIKRTDDRSAFESELVFEDEIEKEIDSLILTSFDKIDF